MAEPLVIGEKRCLSREEAARYCGLSPSRFDEEVRARRFPEALRFGRRTVWDRRALDAQLDRMSGLEAPSQEDPFAARAARRNGQGGLAAP